MTPAERATIETQIERCLRRGELSDAWAHLQRLRKAFPHDAGLAVRLTHLELSLDPEERRSSMTTGLEPAAPTSPILEAESLAGAGKYREAIAIYRSLLLERPDGELFKERLAELFQLAQVSTPHRQRPTPTRILEDLLKRIASRKRT